MTPNDVPPPREYSPEEMRKICDHFRKQITPEDLIEYIEDDAPTVPAEVILADIDAFLADGDRSEKAA